MGPVQSEDLDRTERCRKGVCSLAELGHPSSTLRHQDLAPRSSDSGRTCTSGSSGSQALGMGLNYTTGGPPACRCQSRGLASLHNRTDRFLIMSLFLCIITCPTSSVSLDCPANTPPHLRSPLDGCAGGISGDHDCPALPSSSPDHRYNWRPSSFPAST